jgi:hypothetical protein
MSWKLAPMVLGVAVVMMSGCSSPSTSSGETHQETSTNQGIPTRCDATAAQFAMGKAASPALLEQARTKAGAQTARTLGPNDMVTLEYRSERLNFNTDQTGKVTRINCG